MLLKIVGWNKNDKKYYIRTLTTYWFNGVRNIFEIKYRWWIWLSYFNKISIYVMFLMYGWIFGKDYTDDEENEEFKRDKSIK